MRYIYLPDKTKDSEKTVAEENDEPDKHKTTSEEQRDVSVEDKADVAGAAENDEKVIEEKKPEVTPDSTDAAACEKTTNE